jgi:hypothetical protein
MRASPTEHWAESCIAEGMEWESEVWLARFRDGPETGRPKWLDDNGMHCRPVGAPLVAPAPTTPPKPTSLMPEYVAMDVYVANGWDVIPLRHYTYVDPKNPTHNGKSPKDPAWNTLGYIAPQVITASRDRGGWNVGVLPDTTQLVIDVDPKNGGDASFAKLCADTGFDPLTAPCVITGSGGRHIYLRKPATADISSRALKGRPAQGSHPAAQQSHRRLFAGKSHAGRPP